MESKDGVGFPLIWQISELTAFQDVHYISWVGPNRQTVGM